MERAEVALPVHPDLFLPYGEEAIHPAELPETGHRLQSEPAPAARHPVRPLSRSHPHIVADTKQRPGTHRQSLIRAERLRGRAPVADARQPV